MNTNTQTNDSRASIVDTLTALGGEWARFGLEIGAQAIERSARTLTLAARSLTTLAEALPKQAPPPGAPAAEEAKVEVVDVAADPEIAKVDGE